MMINENSSKVSENNDQSKNIFDTKSNGLYISKIDEESMSIPEETIIDNLIKTAEKNPTFTVLKYKSDPNKDFDITVTYEEYLQQIKTAAKNFIALGLDVKASVGIIGFNHPAWFISQLGTIFAGGISCGIYTTNNADICKFIMNDSNCQIVVVENDELLNKVLSILPELPKLKAIIKYTGDLANYQTLECSIPIYTWNEFLNFKSCVQNLEIENRIRNIKPNDNAILIYTSGTTGIPKGVMITHDNAIFTIKVMTMQFHFKPYEHKIISYLPLSHIAANVIDILCTVTIGVTIYFAQPDALKGSLGKTLKEVRPTLFFGVPRIFEKMREQLQEFICKENEKSKMNKPLNSEKSISLTDNFLTNIKKVLGLDRCEFTLVAAAPISVDTLKYFFDLNIIIQQVYGMSECTGPQTFSELNKIRLESVGSVLKGVEMKISEPDENLIGEICMRGRHVCHGYYNNEKATKETIDSEGWLHSGDLGKIVDNEFLIITGRIKELIITAGGENIAPVPIEEKIKSALPFVSQVMLVGDHRKFISCLLTLKSEVDFETQLPTDNLLPNAIRSLADIGIHASTVSDVIKTRDPILVKFIDETIKKINHLSVSRAAYVQKWVFLPKDFSIIGGELGPTLKMKRPVITNIYVDLINSLYE